MNGTAGALTIGATGVIRTETGTASNGLIGGGFNYGGAMTLTNNGLISSQVSARTLTISAASFTNDGTLEAINGATIRASAGFTQTGGIMRVAGGGTIAALNASNVRQTITLSGGRLDGTGTIDANVANAATIAPGLSAGALTITGDLTFASSSQFQIEIGGATQGSQYDLLTEGGVAALNLDGTLTVTLINGFVPASQQFAVLASNGPIGGVFLNVANGARINTADGLGSFQLNYGPSSPFNPANVVLSNFVAVPEPGAFALLASAALSLLGRRRRR
jgi:fibronectin-binding autotransporter adhesin